MKQKIGFFSREAVPIWKELACETLVVIGFLAGLVALAVFTTGSLIAYFVYAFDPIVHWFVQLGVLGWSSHIKDLVQMTVQFILPLMLVIGGGYVGIFAIMGGYYLVEVILHKLNPEKNLRPVR